MTGFSRRLVLIGDADIRSPHRTLFQHKLRKGISRTVIVMTHAAEALVLLSHNHNGNAHLIHHRAVNIGKNRCKKYHSVHPVLPEKIKIFYLLVIIVCRVHQQYLIAMLIKHLTDALRDPCAAFAGQLGDNHPHQLSDPRFYRLSRKAGRISRFFYGFFDHFTFVRT